MNSKNTGHNKYDNLSDSVSTSNSNMNEITSTSTFIPSEKFLNVNFLSKMKKTKFS